jgi:hypothetical protein
MQKYIKFLILSIILSSNAQAVTCYITMVKASCWKDYNLTVNVLNASTGVKQGTIMVFSGDLWGRDKFECKPGQTLSLEAQFTPVFWEKDDGRIYKARRFWKLPDKVTDDITGWNVTVCYPKWFSDVPYPPEASGDCKCNMGEIPKMEPVKK